MTQGSKMARYTSSISNNVAVQSGGPKKQGLVSSVGRPASVFNTYLLTRAGNCCLTNNKLLPAKTVSYKGTVGMIYPN